MPRDDAATKSSFICAVSEERELLCSKYLVVTSIMALFHTGGFLMCWGISVAQPFTYIITILCLKNSLYHIFFFFKKGTSLVVQCLRFCTSNVEALGSIPGQGTRSHMSQLKACLLQLDTACLSRSRLL